MSFAEPHIDDIVWDDWNLDHIAKHQVTRQEVEEVIALGPIFRETYKGRVMATGPTQTGRILAAVLGQVPEHPSIYYTFSARPASRQERRRYLEAKGEVE